MAFSGVQKDVNPHLSIAKLTFFPSPTSLLPGYASSNLVSYKTVSQNLLLVIEKADMSLLSYWAILSLHIIAQYVTAHYRKEENNVFVSISLATVQARTFAIKAYIAV